MIVEIVETQLCNEKVSTVRVRNQKGEYVTVKAFTSSPEAMKTLASLNAGDSVSLKGKMQYNKLRGYEEFIATYVGSVSDVGEEVSSVWEPAMGKGWWYCHCPECMEIGGKVFGPSDAYPHAKEIGHPLPDWHFTDTDEAAGTVVNGEVVWDEAFSF